MISMLKPNMVGKEREYVKEAFDSNWIAPVGPFIKRFEDKVAEYVNVADAVALSSGTSALHLACVVAGIQPGDIVLCPDCTFAASINPAVYCGATPAFIDVEYKTLNIDVKCLKKAIKTLKPKALVLVHMYGMPCYNSEEILKLCHENDVIVIEDACEALGSTVDGFYCGTLSGSGCFSFNGNKIITTSGGGMFVSNNVEMCEKVRFLSTQAKENVSYYLHKEIGYNYRLSNVCAAIGTAQMESLDAFIKKKNYIHDRYKEAFGNEVLSCLDNCTSNYWLSILKVNNAETFVEKMKERGIETRRVWTPLHTQPCFAGSRFFTEENNSSKAFFDYVCMPSDVSLTDEEIDFVISKAKEFING